MTKEALFACVEEQRAALLSMADDIYDHPELGFQELHAQKVLTDYLKDCGFQVELGTGGVETAFRAEFSNGQGGPRIGLLCEYDALEGLGHACGHHMQGPAIVGAAKALKEHAGDKPFSVVVYGTPAEETAHGKLRMLEQGCFQDIDVALMMHGSPTTTVDVKSMAMSSFVVTFHGKKAHAALKPEDGRSALDAVELMNTGVQYLREHMTSDCRVHYAITDAGGVSPNVVQSEASVLYMVRANKVRDSVKLLARVDKIAQGAALMTETSFDRQFIDGTAELVPNYTLEELLYRIFNEVGLPEYSAEEKALAEALRKTYDVPVAPGIAAGFDADIAADVAERTNGLSDALCGFIMPEYHSAGFVAGSTDVGDVSWQTPAAQVHCVTFPFGAAGHSWQNVSSGGTSLGHKGLINAAKIIACAAIELMNDPDTLQKARDEFARRTKSGYVCPIEPDAVPTAI